MTWQIRSGDEHNHIDGRTHEHHIHLVNQVTGGQHDIIIRLGVASCPSCKRPFPKDDLSALDPKAAVAQALEMLEANHAALMAYAEKHGVPIKVGPLHAQVPAGHKLGANKMLAKERKR